MRSIFAVSVAIATIMSLFSAHAGATSIAAYTAAVAPTNDTSFMALAPGQSDVVNFDVAGAQTTYGGETWYPGTYNTTSTDNGISFAFSVHSVRYGTPYGGFDPVGGTQLLQTGSYDGGTTSPRAEVDLGGLQIGTQYAVQFLIADSRSASAGRQAEIDQLDSAGSSTIDGSSAIVTYANTNGNFGVITASFTADTSIYYFVPNTFSAGTQVNAVRVTMLPEPSALAFCSTGFLCLLGRRRRHTPAT